MFERFYAIDTDRMMYVNYFHNVVASLLLARFGGAVTTRCKQGGLSRGAVSIVCADAQDLNAAHTMIDTEIKTVPFSFCISAHRSHILSEDGSLVHRVAGILRPLTQDLHYQRRIERVNPSETDQMIRFDFHQASHLGRLSRVLQELNLESYQREPRVERAPASNVIDFPRRHISSLDTYRRQRGLPQPKVDT